MVLGLLVLGCGGTGTAPSKNAANSEAPHPTTGSSSTTERANVFDIVDRDAALTVYLNANELRAGPQHAIVLSLFEGLAGGKELYAQLCETCGFNLLDAPSEIALSLPIEGYKADLAATVAVARGNIDPQLIRECLAKITPEFAHLVVTSGPLLLAGEPEAVRSALDRVQNGQRTQPLKDYFYVRYAGENPLEAKELVFAMGRSNGQSEFRIEGSTLSDEAAAMLHQRLLEMRDEAIASVQALGWTAPEQEPVLQLLRGLRIERQDRQVSARLVSRTAVDEAAAFGALAGVAVYGVRRYMTRAKVAEARTTVLAIAKALGDYASDHEPQRFPASGARIPQKVPTGTKYQSAPSEWKQEGWGDIGFTLSTPQYYAYEFETAPTGSRAVVRAVGDLDGNGVQSIFELDVAIDEGLLVIGPTLREQDPLE